MANPNLMAVTSIAGTTTYLAPANTTANTLITNAAASGTVQKVNSITASNVTGTTANVTVTVNSAAAGGGTAYPIVSAIPVPGNSTLVVTDKDTAFYLTEDMSVVVTSGTTSAISFVASHELIS